MNKENKDNKTIGFEAVIPTAWLVAYRRTFSDIPFSKEIFKKIEAIRQREGQQEITSNLKKPELSPQFEARHKLIDKLIFQVASNQILELAAGFSSRGVSMSKDNNIDYVEVDLPSVILEKVQIIKEIAKENNFQVPNRLHFESANVLDLEKLEKAVVHFERNKPLTIINEGLLRYLTFEEKAKVANNIHKLLEEYGGVWITSDISLRKIFSNQNKVMAGYVKKISELTGKDIENNRFEKEDDARKFFEELGFFIERHSFDEVRDNLVSPMRLGLSESQVNDTLEDAVVFVMRCNK